jgi:hypothetical protein
MELQLGWEGCIHWIKLVCVVVKFGWIVCQIMVKGGPWWVTVTKSTALLESEKILACNSPMLKLLSCARCKLDLAVDLRILEVQRLNGVSSFQKTVRNCRIHCQLIFNLSKCWWLWLVSLTKTGDLGALFERSQIKWPIFSEHICVSQSPKFSLMLGKPKCVK